MICSFIYSGEIKVWMKLRDNLKAKTNVVVTQVAFVLIVITMINYCLLNHNDESQDDNDERVYGFRTQAVEDELRLRRRRKRRRKGTQWLLGGKFTLTILLSRTWWLQGGNFTFTFTRWQFHFHDVSLAFIIMTMVVYNNIKV